METSSSEMSGSSSPGVGGPANKQCYGCGSHIHDRFYLLAAERQWHTSCLRCSHCKIHLDNELSCFARSGAIYCKEDYYRLFSGKQCARCCQGIFASEFVMRARELVYHMHCFTCAWCNIALTQGDYFGIRDNLVYCRAHFDSLCSEGELSSMSLSLGPGGELEDITDGGGPLSPAVSLPCSYSPALSPGPGALQTAQVPAPKKGRPRKRKPDSELDGCGNNNNNSNSNNNAPNNNSGSNPTQPPCIQTPLECQLSPSSTLSPLTSLADHKIAGLGNCVVGGGSQRTKRMRTSFKHHQLRTMKSYFSINQNPDAKDLKQLAQKTGLSKRVLQVWFQNARAKWRRNNLRNHDPSAPLVTQPPTTLPQSPGEISSFSEASPLSTSNPLDFAGPPQQAPQGMVATVETTFQELF